jgi:hypothetical protein
MKVAFKRLITLSRSWTVDEALWVLWVYKCEHDEICYQSYWTTSYKMGMTLAAERSAGRVWVKFLGGPNGTREYSGFLSDYVVDRVLMKWRVHKIDWTWLLRFNPDTMTHLKDQLGSHARIRSSLCQQKLLPGFEEPPVTMNDRAHGDYEGGERAIEYVQIGDEIYPILESGRQGCVVQRAGRKLPIRAAASAAESDIGAVHRWSSSGRVYVCEEPK